MLLFVSKKKYENLKGYYDLNKIELEEAKEKLRLAKKSNEAFVKVNAEKEEKIKKLEKTIDVYTKANEEFSNKISELKSLNKKETDTSLSVINALEERNKEVDELKSKYRSAYSLAGARKRKIGKLNETIDKLNLQIEALKKEKEDLKSDRYLKVELPPQKSKKVEKMKIKTGVKNSQANKLKKEIGEIRGANAKK